MPTITVNPDRSVEFLAALLPKLAGPQSRVAFWFYQPVTLPLTAEPLSGPSPFPASGSSLAGHGYLLPLTNQNAATLSIFFAADRDALSALIHLEVEKQGRLQFRSYDSFSVILPGPDLDDRWLRALAEREIVDLPGI